MVIDHYIDSQVQARFTLTGYSVSFRCSNKQIKQRTENCVTFHTKCSNYPINLYHSQKASLNRSQKVLLISICFFLVLGLLLNNFIELESLDSYIFF